MLNDFSVVNVCVTTVFDTQNVSYASRVIGAEIDAAVGAWAGSGAVCSQSAYQVVK